MSESPFQKVAGLRPGTLFKKRLWQSCFPVNFAKFLRTLFLKEHLRRTLHQPHSLHGHAKCLHALIHFMSLALSIPPEHIRKPEVF